MKGMNIVLENIFLIIALISMVAVFTFVIKALLGFAKKDALKGKQQFKKAGISFAVMVVMFIGFGTTMDPVETTDEGDKEQVETAKVDEEKSEAKAKEDEAKKEAEVKAKEAASQTPEERITTFINKELGKETNNDKKRIVSVGYTSSAFAIVLNADDNLTTNLTRTSMLMDASEIFEELQGYDDITGDVTLAFMLDLVDQYGNVEAGRVMSIRLTQETLEKVNFENFNYDNFKNIAEPYLEHRAISEKE